MSGPKSYRRFAWMRAAFWSFTPLPSAVKVALLILVAAILIADSVLRSVIEVHYPLARVLIGTALTIVLALFTWRPPVAAVLLMIGAAFAAVGGGAAEYLIGLAFALALVAGTCSFALTVCYAIVATAWGVVEAVRPNGSLQPPDVVMISVIAMACLLAGIAAREQYENVRAFASAFESHEDEVARQLQHERAIIADELHDVVAHELTIVAMHARVLERSEDPAVQQQSRAAIAAAAVRALTDLRRILDMVNPAERDELGRVTDLDALSVTAKEVSVELAAAGADVDIDIPEDLDLPHTVSLALSRVLRESTTNVIKHAPGAKWVRIRVSEERGIATLTVTNHVPPPSRSWLPRSGYGIVRLHERLRLLGGSFEAHPSDEGWRVTASLPLSA